MKQIVVLTRKTETGWDAATVIDGLFSGSEKSEVLKGTFLAPLATMAGELPVGGRINIEIRVAVDGPQAPS
jgi:hypothetical protein